MWYLIVTIAKTMFYLLKADYRWIQVYKERGTGNGTTVVSRDRVSVFLVAELEKITPASVAANIRTNKPTSKTPHGSFQE